MAVYGTDGEVAHTNAESGTLISRSRPIDSHSLQAFLQNQPVPRTVWQPGDGPTIASAGAAVTITARGPDRIDTVRSAATDIFTAMDVDRETPPTTRPRLIGGLAFHPNHTPKEPWTGFPAALFVLPRVQLTQSKRGSHLTVNAYGPQADPTAVETALKEAHTALTTRSPTPPSQPPGVTGIERVPSRDAWKRGVETALSRITEGTLQKVVLAQSLRANLNNPIHPPSILEVLGDQYPDCYRFLFAPTETATAIGATPERLISRRGRTIETEALAGSIGRGETPTADEGLARSLIESPKDQHEQALVVDTIRYQLEPLAVSITTGDQRVRRLASVQHLQTPIRGRLDSDIHILSLVDALHPTPAVGGLPPDAAQQTIRQAESFDRGWYAAPIGWFDARGNGEFAVAIRSAITAHQTATLYAGAGIVADSEPATEWEEVQLKYRPILDALTK